MEFYDVAARWTADRMNTAKKLRTFRLTLIEHNIGPKERKGFINLFKRQSCYSEANYAKPTPANLLRVAQENWVPRFPEGYRTPHAMNDAYTCCGHDDYLADLRDAKRNYAALCMIAYFKVMGWERMLDRMGELREMLEYAKESNELLSA